MLSGALTCRREEPGKTRDRAVAHTRGALGSCDSLVLATMRTDFALVLTAALLFDTFWRNNGEHASQGPCRPGFSKSFYSMQISRDVLQGQHEVK
ncbi:hypothetical protein ATANTOWER_001708, partial [Ataeniobius toweri]|nr:hypothetical protein [Ataeniobius toweri]